MNGKLAGLAPLLESRMIVEQLGPLPSFLAWCLASFDLINTEFLYHEPLYRPKLHFRAPVCLESSKLVLKFVYVSQTYSYIGIATPNLSCDTKCSINSHNVNN